jgi:hypothetical protein
MDYAPRKPNIDRALRDEKASSVFPPVKVKVASDATTKGLSPSKVTSGRVQKSFHPSSAIRPLELGKLAPASQAERRAERVHFCEPWSSYQKMVYYDDGCDVIGALSIRKRRVARTIIRINPPLIKDRIHQLLDIRHKHIVLLHEAFQTTDTFLVYDTPHISLEVLIGCGEKFKEPQMARICLEVSTAFNYCCARLTGKLLLAIVNLTSKGLQHGNITPSNVFFTSSGITKLGTCHVAFKASKVDQLAYIHECTPSEISITSGSRDLWSLGETSAETLPESSWLAKNAEDCEAAAGNAVGSGDDPKSARGMRSD